MHWLLRVLFPVLYCSCRLVSFFGRRVAEMRGVCERSLTLPLAHANNAPTRRRNRTHRRLHPPALLPTTLLHTMDLHHLARCPRLRGHVAGQPVD